MINMIKKISILSLVVFFLVGCFDITQESTINDDGSGVFTSKTDMGSMLGMLKTMGGDEAKEMDSLKADTTIQLASLKDSLQGLTDVEKKMLDKATLKIVMDVPEEIFNIKFNFPYSKPSELEVINSILKKSRKKIMSDQLEGLIPGEGDDGSMELGKGDDEGNTDTDDYFIYTYEKGKLTRKLNKEKYANVENDKGLKSMQEMGQLSAPMKMKTIFNLPKPAKKAEGKGVKLSSDKKTVTIEGTIDDFFDDPSVFEYTIEY
jgi:hypothetical protein